LTASPILAQTHESDEYDSLCLNYSKLLDMNTMEELRVGKYLTLAEALNWTNICFEVNKRKDGGSNYDIKYVYSNEDRLRASFLIVAYEERVENVAELIQLWEDNLIFQRLSGYSRLEKFPLFDKKKEEFVNFIENCLEEKQHKSYLMGQVRRLQTGGGYTTERDMARHPSSKSEVEIGAFSPFDDRDEIQEKYNPFY